MKEEKYYNVKMPRELWKALKTSAILQERSMQDIINDSIKEYLKKQGYKL
jgi:hypothetical protein